MYFLEKLDYLIEKHQLDKRKLSEVCDIPYHTIESWYIKGYDSLKIATLRKLSTYFATTLDYWVNNEKPVLLKEKYENDIEELLAIYMALSPNLQKYLLKQVNDLKSIQQTEIQEN